MADEDQYPPDNNFYAEVGSFVHEILAKVFSGELPLDDASRYFADNFDDNVFYSVRQSTMDKTFESCADYLATVEFDWLKDYEIVGVEQEVKFHLAGCEFVGYIDLLLRDKKDGKMIVVDHKSSEYPFTQNGSVRSTSKVNYPSHKRQSYLYAHAIHELYGEFPKELWWNHFKDGSKRVVIPFSREEYDEAMKWFEDKLLTIAEEKDYDPSPNFFYCKNLCKYRASCEYKNGA